jgi:hypothetical protein
MAPLEVLVLINAKQIVDYGAAAFDEVCDRYRVLCRLTGKSSYKR